mgnify:CR=1 FL=1
MTTVLFRKDDLEFCVSDTFEGKFLLSLLENMKEKMLNETWDDYNEVHHCCKMIHEFSQIPGLVMDFHTLRRGEEQLGMVLLTHGAISADIYEQSGLHITDPLHQVVLLNYLHIAPEGRGNGTFWVRDLIMPMYADLGYTAFYLKTSHPRAFPFYDRLGAAIANYTFLSDNGIHQRKGRIYRLPLYEKALPKE